MAGDCYANAGRHLMDLWLANKDEGFTLVHGRPILQAPPHIEYGHAWLEFRRPIPALSELTGRKCEMEMVLDVESGNLLPKELFYMAGEIDPDKCIRYTTDEMRRWVLDTGHWGPWEGPDGVGPVPGHKGN